MQNKNEYFDSHSNIFQDPKFANQIKNQISKQSNIVAKPTIDDIKNDIERLKMYSELPISMHNYYINSNCINDLCEYHTYLEERYKMLKK